MKQDKKYEYMLIICLVIVFIVSQLVCAQNVNAQGKDPQLKLIDATAYYDSYGHGYGADGRSLIEGLTVAGRPEWLGMTAILYDLDYRLIGIYEFRDTGYGQPTGRGKSEILPGQSVGTIEGGQCIDIYMTTYEKCKAWGRQKVYIQLIKAEG